MADTRPEFGAALEEGLREALAWKRGELALETVNVDPMPGDPADPEDFDVTAEAMDRARRARLVRTTRTGLHLSQCEFAARFRVPVGTLRDWEQARVTPPDFAVAYVRVIAKHPDIVAMVVA